MEIKVVRDYFTPHTTLGKMFIDGKEFCETLEDCDRNLEDGNQKIPAATAIPRGTYKVIIDHSNRFKKDMPHILDVPQFEGIRIHAGNTDDDTEGCILLGLGRDVEAESITSSRLAIEAFMEKLQMAIRLKEEVTINIS